MTDFESPIAARHSPLSRYLTSCIVVAVILALRRPDAVFHPQLWAEDGTVFLQQQIDLGWRAIFTPYAGYFHLVPRVVAWITGAVVPLQYVPVAYNYSTIIIASAALARLSISTLQIGSPWLLAAIAVTVPHGGEVFVNLTNLQWLLALPLLAILNEDRRSDAPSEWLASVAVLALGLTGPFCILYLPVLVFRALIDNRYAPSAPVVFGLLVAVSAQCFALSAEARDQPASQMQFDLARLSHSVDDLVGVLRLTPR